MNGTPEDTREPAPATYVETIRSRLHIGEMPPERYVALQAHRWMLAGPLVYRYDDPEVDAHVRRVYELLMNGDLDELRRQWLSPEELERVEAEIEAMNDPDYEFSASRRLSPQPPRTGSGRCLAIPRGRVRARRRASLGRLR